MNHVLTIARNDFRRRLGAPAGIVMLILVPVVMIGVVGTVFSPRKSTLPQIPIAVADLDGGFVSRMLIQSLSADESKKMFTLQTVPEAEGHRLVAKGKISALLIIPEGFTERLLRAEPSSLQLEKNPSQQYLPVIAEEFVRTLSLGLSGLVWVFEEEVKAVRLFFNTKGFDLPATLLEPFLQRSKVKIETIRKVVDPLLIGLKKEEVKPAGRRGIEMSIFSYLFPGMSVMFLLFIVQSVLEDLLIEKERGTLRRILMSPVPPGAYILGKMCGAFLVGLACFWVMAGMCRILFSMAIRNWTGLFLLSSVAVAFFSALFALVYALIRNRRQASVVTTPMILVFSVLGGSMLPLEQLGKGLRSISRLTPNYWFITGSHQLTRGGFPGLPILVFTLCTLAAFIAAFLLLRKRLA